MSAAGCVNVAKIAGFSFLKVQCFWSEFVVEDIQIELNNRTYGQQFGVIVHGKNKLGK